MGEVFWGAFGYGAGWVASWVGIYGNGALRAICIFW